MQSLGTEWGRELIHPDLWVDAWARSTEGLVRVVCDDVRFTGEAARIHELGGKIVRLDREGCSPGPHRSEREYLDITPDAVVVNPLPVGGVCLIEPKSLLLARFRQEARAWAI